MRHPAEASRANVFQYSHSSKSAQSEREAALKLRKCILSWREAEPRLAPTVGIAGRASLIRFDYTCHDVG